jgi:L-serine kinase (ATP) / ParB family transcriptional regulator, heme-responsive regulator
MVSSSQYRVLITVPFHKAGLQLLASQAAIDYRPKMPTSDVQEIICNYQAWIAAGESHGVANIIAGVNQLKVVGISGRIPHNIDVDEARKRGIEIVRVFDRFTLAGAEQAMRLILTLAHDDGGDGLAGKGLGIISIGNVWTEVARRAWAFSMNVFVHKPDLKMANLRLGYGTRSSTLERMFRKADYICLVPPRGGGGLPLITINELNLCRPTSYLINIGDPSSVDLPALRDALDARKLAGAGLALPPNWEGEWPIAPHPRIRVIHMQETHRDDKERERALALAEKVIDKLRRPNSGTSELSLRVVATEDVQPHEFFNPDRVDRLAKFLQTADYLAHPPVVVEWEKKYVVLDGATRTQAFRKLGYPSIVVQVVSPQDGNLELRAWHHAVTGIESETLMECLSKNDSYYLKEVDPGDMQQQLDLGDAVAAVDIPDGDNYLVCPREEIDSIDAMNALVADYTKIGRIVRTLHTNSAIVQEDEEDIAGLVIFPNLTLASVLRAASIGQLLPAGITRFVIPGRVLRIVADMDVLRSDRTISEKNDYLKDLIDSRMANKRVRYYQEPVLLLDD